MATLIINFKTYEQGTGEKALELAKIAEKIANESNKEIILSVQAVDIKNIVKTVKIPVFVQHMDAVEYGSNTGAVLPEAVKQAGATGCLINHSEKRLDRQIIEAIINRAKSLGLRTCICAQNPDEAADLSNLKPEFVAFEPPELIGGEISVSTAKPELIKESVDKIKSANPEVKVLVGAGIKDINDVKKSIELGAEGVLVASHIVKAENPEEVVREIIEGLG